MATTWPTVGVIGKLAETPVPSVAAPTGLLRPGDTITDESDVTLTDESDNELTG